jgi:hypothetical protein
VRGLGTPMLSTTSVTGEKRRATRPVRLLVADALPAKGKGTPFEHSAFANSVHYDAKKARCARTRSASARGRPAL